MVQYEYAKALFDLAIEEKKTELFLDYLNGILDVINDNKDFYKLIASPLVEIEEKLKIIKTVFKSLDTTFKEFMGELIKNNRFVLLEQITEEYSQLLNDYNSILKIEVISSEKLSKERLNEVTRSLEQRYPDKKLRIENTVNEKILSGLQIICNGESLDMSLKNRLTKLKHSLEERINICRILIYLKYQALSKNKSRLIKNRFIQKMLVVWLRLEMVLLLYMD